MPEDTVNMCNSIELKKHSEWRCYLFGCRDYNYGMVYTPVEDAVPNWFVRFMMRICLGCVWVKERPSDGETFDVTVQGGQHGTSV
jgi:hypothetical protein